MRSRSVAVALTVALGAAPVAAQSTSALHADLDRRVSTVMSKVVAWRRDIHQNPELGNRETRTSKLVADHLKALGMEVRTGVAHTGVVAVLKGGRPGPVVALRADMDALPVTEQVNLPFASKVKATYNDQEVGVMHACGHDNHVAILMGVAEVLAGMKAQIPGTVKFIFQPAEEGPPAGEEGGALMMVKQGALESPKPDAIFGLHVMPFPVGTIAYRPQGALAAADWLRIVVRGKQTHGAIPWGGIDPIVVASQIVLGLQTIPSRQTDVTVGPAIVTIGAFQGGLRENIIPDSVLLRGTIRTFDAAMQQDIHARVKRTAEMIAASAGATATVDIRSPYPVTYNDPALTERMLPSLKRAANGKVQLIAPVMASEDFSEFQKVVPGLFVMLGVVPEGQDPKKAASNHSPLFFADEAALPVGVRTMASLAIDYLSGGTQAKAPVGSPDPR
jgi:amidohydrolase